MQQSDFIAVLSDEDIRELLITLTVDRAYRPEQDTLVIEEGQVSANALSLLLRTGAASGEVIDPAPSMGLFTLSGKLPKPVVKLTFSQDFLTKLYRTET